MSITIADERVSLVVRSVIIAMESETFALATPPMMRLTRKMRNTLESDQVAYETSVPV